jgi:hypothetical protein
MGRNGPSGTSPFDGNAAGNAVFLLTALIPADRPHILAMAAFQKFAPREPPKTKEQLREMLRQAVQNTQPEKKPKARKDQG